MVVATPDISGEVATRRVFDRHRDLPDRRRARRGHERDPRDLRPLRRPPGHRAAPSRSAPRPPVLTRAPPPAHAFRQLTSYAPTGCQAVLSSVTAWSRLNASPVASS